YIGGYVFAWDFQRALGDAVIAYCGAHPELEKLFEQFVIEPVSVEPPKLDFEKMIEDRPDPSPKTEEPTPSYGRAVKVNYLEREQENGLIGRAGEEVALAFEKWRLIRAGKESLADKVEWISQTKGDGLGYDIRSYSENGKDRF